MRRITYSTLLFLLLTLSAVAQNGGINFQGMARNTAGEPLANQKISLRLSVLINSESGTVEYSETKEATTSGQGVFSVVIGDGNMLTKTGNFSDINWKNPVKFLKVELDPSGGTNFALMGTSRLQAVPFAYYANGVDADNIQGTLPVAKGGTGVGSITALKTSLGIDQVNNTSDANKPLSTAAQATFETKVDKVTGKGLSANDYTSAEKSKLAAITGTNTGDQDLTGFATTAALAGKVDKVTGKELSSNDYSTAEKNKLAAITGTNTGDQDLSGFATTAALAGKANTADVTAALATKATASEVTSGLAGKVDKVTGKELSSNDYSTAEKNKLAGITGTNTGDQDLSGYATTAALAGKANTADVTAALATKATASEVTTGLAAKVDKVTGKELSSNDYSTAEKNKLAAITGTNTGDQDLSGYTTTAQLATKANATDVTTSLANKVDKVIGKGLSTNDYSTSEKDKLAAITGTNTGDQVNITGNAGTATKLANARNINDVPFDGTANITVTADAGTLTGTTLKSTVTGSSLTSVGTITSGVWSGTAVAVGKGGTGLTIVGTNGQVLSSNGTSMVWTTPYTGDKHSIGESYGGGIVFYVYDGGKHGLIAATSDQSTGIRWFGGSKTNTRARADGVGAGLKNTAIIIANQGTVDGNSFAATVCNEYSVTVDGVTYGDWYLPSRNELNLLYLQKSVVGVFADNFYWSSTEEGGNLNAWSQSFYNGGQGNFDKSLAFYVRAIRAF